MTLPAAVEEERPLVAKEQAMWLFHEYADEEGVLDVAFAMESVDGRLDLAALRAAVDVVVGRHPALRARFREVDGEPRRIVLAAGGQPGADLVRLVEVAEDELAAALAASASVRFDLANDAPIRVTALVSASRAIVCVTVDHLVYDAYSAQVVRRDLQAGYAALAAGRPVPTELTAAVVGPPVQDGTAASVRFWTEALAGARPSRDLDLGRHAGRTAGFPGDVARVRVDPPAWAAAEELARGLSCPPSAVALAAFATVLHRHGAGDDLVIGMPTYNRGRPAHEAVGYYTCIQPIRLSLAGAPRFSDLVRACAHTMLEGLQYADTSLDEIQPNAYEAGGDTRRPLVRYLFNYVADLPELADPDPAWADVPLSSARSRMELDLAFTRDADGVALRAIYAADVFDADQVVALQNRVQAVLVAAAEADASIDELPIATPADLALLAQAGGQPAPSQHDVVEDVATSAFADPQATAFAPVADRWPAGCGYGELAATVDALAQSLRDRGVRPGGTVAVRTTSLADTATAVLACWVAGVTADLDGADGAVQISDPGAGDLAVEYRPGTDQPPLFERSHPEDLALRWTDEHGDSASQTHQAVADAVAALTGGLRLSADDVLAVSDLLGRGPALAAALAALGRGCQVFGVAVDAPPAASTVWISTPGQADRLFDARQPRPAALTRVGLHGDRLPSGIAGRAAEFGVDLIRLYGPVAPAGLCLTSPIGPDASPGFVAGPAAALVVDGSGRPALPYVRGVLEVAGRRGSAAAPVRLTPAGIEVVDDDPALAQSEPSQSDPPPSERSKSDPARSDSVQSDSVQSDSVLSEPSPSEPAQPDSASSDADPAATRLGDVDIVELWRTVLGREDVGPHDNFFVLGGNSLQAAKVIGQLKKRTGLRVSLRTAFKNPTPVRFVEAVRTANGDAVSVR